MYFIRRVLHSFGRPEIEEDLGALNNPTSYILSALEAALSKGITEPEYLDRARFSQSYLLAICSPWLSTNAKLRNKLLVFIKVFTLNGSRKKAIQGFDVDINLRDYNPRDPGYNHITSLIDFFYYHSANGNYICIA